MIMIRHTAGPWRADKWAGDDLTISAPDSHYSICHLADCNNAEANAMLIASAPALLEACKAFIPTWNNGHQLEKTDVALRLAREAIAQAEGKA